MNRILYTDTPIPVDPPYRDRVGFLENYNSVGALSILSHIERGGWMMARPTVRDSTDGFSYAHSSDRGYIDRAAYYLYIETETIAGGE